MAKGIPEETKQRAIRLVLDHRDEQPNLAAACDAVAKMLGFGAESLRREVRQAEVDSGARHGTGSSESERMRRLRRENRELRAANAILRDAAVFVAGELDPDAADLRLHRRAARQRPLGRVDLQGPAGAGCAGRRADISGMGTRPAEQPRPRTRSSSTRSERCARTTSMRQHRSRFTIDPEKTIASFATRPVARALFRRAPAIAPARRKNTRARRKKLA